MSRSIRGVRLLAAWAAGIALAAAAHGIEKEQKIRKSDMPEAVQATADRESAGATVKEYAKGVEKGQAVFAMDVTADGHAKEILIGGDGNIVSIREEIPLGSCRRRRVSSKAGGPRRPGRRDLQEHRGHRLRGEGLGEGKELMDRGRRGRKPPALRSPEPVPLNDRRLPPNPEVTVLPRG
jgi:hypothetical protein